MSLSEWTVRPRLWGPRAQRIVSPSANECENIFFCVIVGTGVFLYSKVMSGDADFYNEMTQLHVDCSHLEHRYDGCVGNLILQHIKKKENPRWLKPEILTPQQTTPLSLPTRSQPPTPCCHDNPHHHHPSSTTTLIHITMVTTRCVAMTVCSWDLEKTRSIKMDGLFWHNVKLLKPTRNCLQWGAIHWVSICTLAQ